MVSKAPVKMAKQMRGRNREKIVESGFRLFYEKGFEVTGIQEIARASGVPKGSFYNYFESKTEFVSVVLRLYAERQSEYLQQNLIEGDGSPLARLKSLFETWKVQFFEEESLGCLAGNLGQELANNGGAVQATLAGVINELQSFYVSAIRAIQEAGEISGDLDAESTGAFLYDGWQGAMIRAKATGSSRPFEQFIDLVFGQVLR